MRDRKINRGSIHSTLENKSTNAQGRDVAGQLVETWCSTRNSLLASTLSTLTWNTGLVLCVTFKNILQGIPTDSKMEETHQMKNEEQVARES